MIWAATIAALGFLAPPPQSDLPLDARGIAERIDAEALVAVMLETGEALLEMAAAAPAHGIVLEDPNALIPALDDAWTLALAGDDALLPSAAAMAVVVLLEGFDQLRPLAPERSEEAARRIVTALLSAPEPATSIYAALPPDAEYRGLQAALAQYESLAASGGFVPVPRAIWKAKPQKEHVAVIALRARLHQEDARVGGDADPLFGDDVVDGLRRARQRFLLEPKDSARGQLDKALLDALAVRPEERARLIRIALRALRRSERYDLPYHVRVNLPEFALRVVDRGVVVHQTSVVVGTPGGGGLVNATPTLSSTIRTVVFNPPWTVPQRIFRKEMISEYEGELPPETDEAAFEAFWADKGYELHGRTEKSRYLRLPPGPRNPLGKVKLLFENRHSVYLHDTQSKKLFKKTRRAYSHGCIRVQGPVELAEALLRRDGTWGAAVEARVLEHWEETPIHLARPIPLLLEYIPVVMGEDGIQFLWDMYGRFRPAKAPAKALRPPRR